MDFIRPQLMAPMGGGGTRSDYHFIQISQVGFPIGHKHLCESHNLELRMIMTSYFFQPVVYEHGFPAGPRPSNPPPVPPRVPLTPRPSGATTASFYRSSISLPSEAPRLTPCCVCTRFEVQIWKCVQCDDSFCDDCWRTQRPHLVSHIEYQSSCQSVRDE